MESPHRSLACAPLEIRYQECSGPKIRTMKQLLMKTNAQKFMFKVSLFSVCWGADDVLGFDKVILAN